MYDAYLKYHNFNVLSYSTYRFKKFTSDCEFYTTVVPRTNSANPMG